MQVERRVPARARQADEWLPLTNWARNIHVVGVAGSGLRGIVSLLHERGIHVTGSDLADGPVLERFRRSGIVCRVGHSSTNVEQDTNLVLISAAVQESNPEVQTAIRRCIPVWKYAECLGRLMSEKDGIAVAGTHGKTTTTAMLSLVLTELGHEPTFVIGGEYPGLGGSSRWGKGHLFVAEACEFDRSFLNLRPKMSIVTNIEEDHLDYFGSLKEIQGAFAEFVSILPEDGYLVVNRDDANSSYLSEFCRSPVGTFSLRPRAADWWAEDVVASGGGSSFRIVGQSGESVRVDLRVPGNHNVYNALAVMTLCRHLGLSPESVASALGNFSGVRRRFDILHRGSVMVVDDYAHHPTEMRAVLRAARQTLADRRLIVVFQPHQHSRLKNFRAQFADVLSLFDVAIVTDVFRARDTEEDVQLFQSNSLVATMRDKNPQTNVVYAPAFADVHRVLERTVRDNDAVIFMGAGSISDLAKVYAEAMSDARR